MPYIVAQYVSCPECRFSWDIPGWRFVKHGDEIQCPKGCRPFIADEATVRCCVDGPQGLEETGLRPFPTEKSARVARVGLDVIRRTDDAA